MIQSIKKQIKLSLGDCGIGLGFTAGCVVFGLIFTQMMRVAGPSNRQRWHCLRRCSERWVQEFISLCIWVSLLINFKLQVGWGVQRKVFLFPVILWEL